MKMKTVTMNRRLLGCRSFTFLWAAHTENIKTSVACCIWKIAKSRTAAEKKKKIEGKERRRMRAQGKKSQKEMLQSSKGQANGNSMTAGRDGQARIKDAGRRTQDGGPRTRDRTRKFL